MAAKKQPVSRWHNGTTPIEELSETEQIAHGIVTEFGYLTPSVERIMDAELSDEGILHALSAFQESLGATDDPNRDPRVAIANAAKI